MGRWREIRDVVFLPPGRVPSRRRMVIGGVIGALVIFIMLRLIDPERPWIWNLVYAIVFTVLIQVVVYYSMRGGKYAGSDPEPGGDERPAPDDGPNPR